MCVILIGNVDWETHKVAKKENGDGFSLFTKELGCIKNPSEKTVEKAIGKWGIWHYRIGTSGKKDTTNIHPFKVCKGEYLLYHNGVLGQGKAELSDTHAFAKTLENCSLETVKTVLAAMKTGSYQRFVLANIRNPYEFYLYGDWSSDKGLIMSHKLLTAHQQYGTVYSRPVQAKIGYPENFTRDVDGYSDDGSGVTYKKGKGWNGEAPR